MIGLPIYVEELEALWGTQFVADCVSEATTIRKCVWEEQKAMRPGTGMIDFEPSPELVLAVAVRKLLRTSMYNKGDFPP